jgi:hypothetical protein
VSLGLAGKRPYVALSGLDVDKAMAIAALAAQFAVAPQSVHDWLVAAGVRGAEPACGAYVPSEQQRTTASTRGTERRSAGVAGPIWLTAYPKLNPWPGWAKPTEPPSP